MPVPPGAMVGVDVVTPRSDDAERVGTEGVEVLLPGVGSEVEELTFKDPPVSAEFGAALEMTLIGTKTSLLPAGLSGPVMEQVIGPVGIGPMQPEGREVISTPAGGVNDMEIGAAAFDGPPFVTVRVADPVPPGTIPAVIEAVERSAWPGPTATDEAMCCSCCSDQLLLLPRWRIRRTVWSLAGHWQANAPKWLALHLRRLR